MTPTLTLTKEAKAKDGRNILITGEVYDERLGNSDSAPDIFTTIKVIEKETGIQLNSYGFGAKYSADDLNLEVDNFVNNVDKIL